ncbi:MAG: Glu/Leu/Phe/Val dehydrogenase, partial [Chloroflexi bacterium]
MLEDLIRTWDGEQVVVRFDRATGSWMFICIHSRRRGPACGGTRLKTYPDLADAMADAMKLSTAMTLKMAVADMPFGGGKAVLAVPATLSEGQRHDLILRYADLVASLGGSFQTGPDINTSIADMDLISERCPYVVCRSVERGGSGDPGKYTARGVFHGIRASVNKAFGSPELECRTVLVQGVGDVGSRLAEQLAAAGARVLVSDVAQDRVQRLVAAIDAKPVPVEETIGTKCDVYSPCALGGSLNAGTIPRLRCRIVAGSANNQLAEPQDADRLRAVGILYAPDFVINAGGVLYAWGLEALGWSRETIEVRHRGIGDTLAEIYA